MSPDGSHERNTSGLLAHAHEKSEVTLNHVLAVIDKMIAQGKPVNYNSVAREAGTAKTYLYRQPELRRHIDSIRKKPAIDPALLGRLTSTLTDEQIERLADIEDKLNDLNKEFAEFKMELRTSTREEPI